MTLKFSFQVTDLLGKYPDLMDEFNEFLERCENIGDCFSTFYNCFSCIHMSMLMMFLTRLFV